MPRPKRASRPPTYDTAAACAAARRERPQAGPPDGARRAVHDALASAQSPFEALVESIIYQQLHGKAAATIHTRLLESFHPADGTALSTSPRSICWTAPTSSCAPPGSRITRALALRDLAAKTLDGTVPTLARIRRMSDDDIVEHLTQVRGIGRWTVEMLLIFRLGRPDVLPVADYGVRKGFALTFWG